MSLLKNHSKQKNLPQEILELWKEKNTAVEKLEEASNFQKGKSFKFIIFYFNDINILCH